MDVSKKYGRLTMAHKDYLNEEQFDIYKKYIYAGNIDGAKKILLENISEDCMIYKYYQGINRDWNSITKPELWLCQAGYFNDPYDCAFLYNCHSKKVYDSKEEQDLAVKEYINQFEQDKKSDSIQSAVFVGCFSERNDSLLMWSHYADEHRGICIGYNLYNLIKNYNCFPVIYSNEMPQEKELSLDKPYSLMKYILTKYSEWSYEKEWRIIQIDSTCTESGKLIAFEKPLEVYMGLEKKVENKYSKNHEKYDTLKSKDNSIKVSEVIKNDDFYVDNIKITNYRRKLRYAGEKLGLYNFELSRQKFELERRKWDISI